MPQTVNGIGTHYYGKKNLQTRSGICNSCRRETVLSSYDTRLWFVVVFIPIIPLGQKHIVDFCPRCTRHRVLSLKDWERIKNQNLSEAMAGMTANPDDPKAAIKAHSALVAFGQNAEADKLMLLLKDRFANDASVQAYLGSTLQYIGKMEESIPYYQRALALDPDLPQARVAIAFNLIQKNQLDEAHKLLKFLEAPGKAEYPGTLYALAEGYQRAGRHVEAMGVYNLLIERFPKLAQDKKIRKAIKQSEAAAGVVTSKLPAREVRWGPIIAWSAIAVLLLVAVFGSNYYISQHRTLYLVSALPQPVTVEIPGHGKTTFSNRGLWTKTLPEGHYRATLTGGVKDTVDIDITSSFWARWFSKPIYVLNAGGSKILFYINATYSSNAGDRGASYNYYYGKSFFTLANVDYPFEPFPKSITLDSGNSSQQKSHIELYKYEPQNAFNFLITKHRYNEAFDLIEWHLRLHPEDAGALPTYTAYTRVAKQEPRARAFLEEGIKRRPVELEWHRMYQEIRLLDGRERPQVIADYTALLQADPTNSTLLYLLGRLQTSKSKAIPLYQNAVAQNPNNFFAHYALGESYMELADWTKAASQLDDAVRLQPENSTFQQARFLAAIAMNDFAPQEKVIQARLAKSPLSYLESIQLGQLYIAQDRSADLKRLINNFETGAPDEYGDTAEESVKSFKARLFYSSGKFEDVLALEAPRTKFRDHTPDRFNALVELGRLPEAAEALKARGTEIDPFDWLSLSIACKVAGDETRAADNRKQAIAALIAERPESAVAAGWLDTNQPVSFAEVMDLALPGERKRILLAAVAQLHPDNNSELLATARKLNYSQDFPYHLIKRITQSAAK